MSWNFRLVRDDDVIYMREVYYDDAGNPEMMTTGEIKIFCEIGEDLNWYREAMTKALQKPVVDYPFDKPRQMELFEI